MPGTFAVPDDTDQLALGLDHRHDKARGQLTVGEHFPHRVAWRLAPEGLGLEVHAEGPGPALDRVFSFSLRTRPPTELAVAGSRFGRRLHWGMCGGVPVLADRDDVFAAAVRLFPQRAFGRLIDGSVADVDSRDRRLAADAMLRLYEQLRALALHAAATCDPEARRVAMPFSPAARFRVYSLVLDDRTGRLAQFAIALLESGEPRLREPGGALLAEVVAGRRLNRAQDDAIAVWAERAPKAGMDAASAIIFAGRSPWTRLQRATAAEFARVKLEQRLLVRRAGPREKPAELFLPPPVAFAPDDIPLTPRANARWFRVMKATPATLWLDPARPDLGAALSSFASRNAAALRRRLGRDDLEGWWVEMGCLADYVSATGCPPARSSDPIALVDRAERWLAPRLMEEEVRERGAADLSEAGGRDCGNGLGHRWDEAAGLPGEEVTIILLKP